MSSVLLSLASGIAMLYVILSLVCGVLAVFTAERLIG